LASLADELSQRDIVVLISNHNTQFTRGIYQSAEITELEVSRTISCNGANRKKASELLALFTPVPLQDQLRKQA
jgi:DNA adenine methylase